MDLQKYDCLVGYGIGHYYEKVKDKVKETMQLDYLSDIKWESFHGEYDGIKVIAPDELSNLSNPLVIIFSGADNNYHAISDSLQKKNLPYIHIKDIVGGIESTVTGKMLEGYKNRYQDAVGNVIEFDGDVPLEMVINFRGSNSYVKIGKNVRARKLSIHCGNRAYCMIGDEAEMGSVLLLVSEGSVTIGEKCLFSDEIIIRNHDSHHIFDRNTGKRINYPGSIKIGNHVWVGHGATLLGNAEIGDNSIVGARAVTSSKFPKEVVIAGNPAKVIRRDVCWARDLTYHFNRASLDECIDQEAYEYFEV